jgi:hypothetical protein
MGKNKEILEGIETNFSIHYVPHHLQNGFNSLQVPFTRNLNSLVVQSRELAIELLEGEEATSSDTTSR